MNEEKKKFGFAPSRGRNGFTAAVMVCLLARYLLLLLLLLLNIYC